jgi:hypothetical protein
MGELTATFTQTEFRDVEVYVEAANEADARKALDLLGNDLEQGKMRFGAEDFGLSDTVYITVNVDVMDTDTDLEDEGEWEGEEYEEEETAYRNAP